MPASGQRARCIMGRLRPLKLRAKVPNPDHGWFRRTALDIVSKR